MQLQKTNSEHRAAFTIKFKVAWLCFDLVQAPSGLSHKWNGPLIAQTKAGIINNHFSKLLPWNAMRTPPPAKQVRSLSPALGSHCFWVQLFLGHLVRPLRPWVSDAILFDLSLKSDLSYWAITFSVPLGGCLGPALPLLKGKKMGKDEAVLGSWW